MIAEAFGWDERNKLIHLTMRLAGTALAYYRCTTEQQRSYDLLKEELERRFMPVHVQSVQSGLFHERAQRSGRVRPGAQEIVISCVPQDGSRRWKAVVASRFVAGLKRTLQERLIGAEGDLMQLLARPRFEETKRKELKLDDGEKPSLYIQYYLPLLLTISSYTGHCVSPNNH